ncbi:hypothetical protein TpMuguga_03g00329 [Theileria parva strain Muguga]|uniref:Uncharacterized protein n=1 Tax=Theileria parva TaxID=5875 RepID=Q4N025_THEPA|nr:uncharacterized protein TpMuguga_03g00329 [Theileria parva strain Muguga]EAN31064.1 hypothetical protein TpMuguga_03g00329 [Theileria parva strain Muguga]|eukprot:XP_763347.1 hypothetical protein [Theileria parva strain Muguga]
MSLSSETQYFFDLTDRQWWVLGPSSDDWEELSNEEAYKLGLFKAVLTQNCNFIDADIEQYNSVTSQLIKDLETKFSLNDSSEGAKLVENKSNSAVTKVLSKDFSNLEPQNLAHNSKSDPNLNKSKQNITNSEQNITNSDQNNNNLDQNLTNSDQNINNLDQKVAEGSKLLSQINNLIASTSEMKQKCEAREMSGRSTPNLRSTARHLTYVNNGGLAGCLKTVAEERKKMGQSKKSAQKTQNPQLQEMIQRAKAMAAKTMDDAKDSEAMKSDKNQPKKPLRTRGKKYTTVFGANAMKDLSQKLPDVTFEGSSDEESDS